MVEELSSVDAKQPWFLLPMFFPLPLAIWCLLVLLSLTVACASCKPMCQYSWETSALCEEFVYGELWHKVSSRLQTETGRILFLLFLGSCVLIALGRSLLGQEFE